MADIHLPLRDRVAEVAHEGVDVCQQSRQAPNAHETTIIVYDNEDWTKDFRQFVRLSWRMQQEALGGGGHGTGARLSQLLQLVVFHPQATHQTCEQACMQSALRSLFCSHLIMSGLARGTLLCFHRMPSFACRYSDCPASAADFTIRSPYPALHVSCCCCCCCCRRLCCCCCCCC